MTSEPSARPPEERATEQRPRSQGPDGPTPEARRLAGQRRDAQLLDQAVRMRREREARSRREGLRSIGQDLALIGVIGWTIVVPTLLGIFAGRWLDVRLHGGIFWTLGLLAAGLALGCWLAWQKLQRP